MFCLHRYAENGVVIPKSQRIIRVTLTFTHALRDNRGHIQDATPRGRLVVWMHWARMPRLRLSSQRDRVRGELAFLFGSTANEFAQQALSNFLWKVLIQRRGAFTVD